MNYTKRDIKIEVDAKDSGQKTVLQNRLRKEKKILISVAELNWRLFVLARLVFSV